MTDKVAQHLESKETRKKSGTVLAVFFWMLALIALLLFSTSCTSEPQIIKDDLNVAVEQLEQQNKELGEQKEEAEMQLARAKYDVALRDAKTEDTQAERIRLSEKLDLPFLYQVPQDLFYTFLVTDSAYISQTPREHYAANGLLATDVATGGKRMEVKAPDLHNEAVQWDVELIKEWGEVGSAVRLTNGDERFLIGHVSPAQEIETGMYDWKTGDFIGHVLCPGDENAGATTGCHVHIEYQTRVGNNWINSEYRVEENYNLHDVWKDKKDEAKKYADAGYWYISSYYSPVEGQTSYYTGDYKNDYNINCHGNCLSPADGGALYTQADKYQVVACPSQFPLGTKFRITLPEDHEEHPNKTWTVTCRDRGGAVRTADTNSKGQSQLDLWSGIGVVGQDHPWIGELSSKKAIVKIVD